MATETELEAMVVRLLGDSSSYEKMIKSAVAATESGTSEIVAQANKLAATWAQQAETFNMTSRGAQLYALQMRGATESQLEGARAASNINAALEQHHATMVRGAQVTDSVRTASERHAVKVQELDFLLSKGAITQDTFTRAVEKSSEELFRNTNQLNQLGIAAMAAGTALASVFGSSVKDSVLASAHYEQTALSLETMLGSAKEAKRTLQDMTNYAAQAHFKLSDVETATKLMVTFGDRGYELTRNLRIVGNAAAASGANFADLALIFNQIRGAGQLLMQDFRQLSTRGVLSLQDLATHFGTTTEAVHAMQKEGKITFNDVRETLEEMSKTGRFAGAIEKAASGLSGKFTILEASTQAFKRSIGDQLAPAVKLVTDKLIGFGEIMAGMPEWLKAAIAGTLVLVTAMGSLLLVAGASILVYNNLIRTVLALVTAQRAWAVASFAAQVAIAGLVLAAIYGIGKLGERLFGLKHQFQEVNDEIEKGRKLSEPIVVNYEKRTKDIIERSQEVGTPTERQDFLRDEIRKANVDAKSYAQSIESLKKKVEEFDTVGAAVRGNAIFGKQAKEDLALAEKQLESARKRASELNDELNKIKPPETDPKLIKMIEDATDKLHYQAATLGMASHELAVYEIQWKGATEEMVKDLYALSREVENKKLAYKIAEDARETIKSLEEEAATFKMTGDEIKLYQMRKQALKFENDPNLRVNTAYFERIQALIREKKAREDLNKIMEEGKQLTNQMRTAEEVFMDRVVELDSMLAKGAIGADTFQRAMDDARKKLDAARDSTRAARQEFERFNAALAGSAESEARIREYTEHNRMLREEGLKKGRGAEELAAQARQRVLDLIAPAPRERGYGGAGPADTSVYFAQMVDLLRKIAEQKVLSDKAKELGVPVEDLQEFNREIERRRKERLKEGAGGLPVLPQSSPIVPPLAAPPANVPSVPVVPVPAVPTVPSFIEGNLPSTPGGTLSFSLPPGGPTRPGGIPAAPVVPRSLNEKLGAVPDAKTEIDRILGDIGPTIRRLIETPFLFGVPLVPVGDLQGRNSGFPGPFAEKNAVAVNVQSNPEQQAANQILGSIRDVLVTMKEKSPVVLQTANL